MKIDTKKYLKAKKRGDVILDVDLLSGRILSPYHLSLYKELPKIEPMRMTIDDYEYITSKNKKITTCADIYDKVKWNSKGQVWIEDDNTEKNILK